MKCKMPQLSLLLFLLPLFGHALANAPCQVFLSNSHVNASLARVEGFSGVIDLWFWAANGTNFTVTYPRENPAKTYTATFKTLKTAWIKTTLDWPVGTYWEHEGTLSIPSVHYLKGDKWVTQLTINLGDDITPRMVVASSDPMIWIKQKSCDITGLDPKIFTGSSSCPSYPDEAPAVTPSSVTTAAPAPAAAAATTDALIVPTTDAAQPTAAANIHNAICSQKGSSSNSSSLTIVTVLLVLVSLAMVLLSVYTYRLRNQLGITGAHVSFQPLKNDGTTMPRSVPNGSQNGSLQDVSVPLH